MRPSSYGREALPLGLATSRYRICDDTPGTVRGGAASLTD